jgi:hypothetical protein
MSLEEPTRSVLHVIKLLEAFMSLAGTTKMMEFFTICGGLGTE